MSACWTQDGTFNVFDPEIGLVTGPSEVAVWREVDRRKAMKRERRQA
jgi:hypothetical protein